MPSRTMKPWHLPNVPTSILNQSCPAQGILAVLVGPSATPQLGVLVPVSSAPPANFAIPHDSGFVFENHIVAVPPGGEATKQNRQVCHAQVPLLRTIINTWGTPRHQEGHTCFEDGVQQAIPGYSKSSIGGMLVEERDAKSSCTGYIDPIESSTWFFGDGRARNEEHLRSDDNHVVFCFSV